MRVEGSLSLFRLQRRAKEFLPIAPMISAPRWLQGKSQQPTANSQKLRGNSLSDSLQLAFHGTVVNGATDADHGASQQRRVQCIAGADFLAGGFLNLRFQRSLLRITQFAGAEN